MIATHRKGPTKSEASHGPCPHLGDPLALLHLLKPHLRAMQSALWTFLRPQVTLQFCALWPRVLGWGGGPMQKATYGILTIG